MDNQKQILKSGIFVLIGIIVIATTIIILGGNSPLFHSTVKAIVKFDEVQGLGPGAVVSLAGLPVGNVSDIQFDGKRNQVIVELELRKTAFDKLTQGTQAEVRTQGALGDKYIYIVAGDPDSAPLEEGVEIPAKKSLDILSVISEKGKEAERIFEIINETYALLKSINEGGQVQTILSNLNTASSSFKGLADKGESSMAKLDRVMEKIERGEGTLGALISDPSIHDQIKTMLGGPQRKTHVKSMLRKSVESNENGK